MEEVLSKLSTYQDAKFVIIMDNLSCHRTPKLLNYYSENKLNIIFNCVYRSSFNCVELAFKSIKFHLYNNLYESLEQAEKDIKNKLDDKNFNSVLLHNYWETLNIYLEFYEKYRELNLNFLNI